MRQKEERIRSARGKCLCIALSLFSPLSLSLSIETHICVPQTHSHTECLEAQMDKYSGIKTMRGAKKNQEK